MNKQEKNISSTINTQYIYSENEKVFLKNDKENEQWFPINFKWEPLIFNTNKE